MSYDTILTEQRGEVLLITLNRPERLNAWTPGMAEELWDAMERGNKDPNTGAMVMTGAGRGFCAGADMEDTSSAQGEASPPCASMPDDVHRSASQHRWRSGSRSPRAV